MSEYNENKPPEKGDRVHVHMHEVIGTVAESYKHGVKITKDDGGTAIFGSFYFDQMSKLPPKGK